MNYNVVLTPGAEKQYKTILKNKSLTKKIQKAFAILSQNPYIGKFLVGELKGYHSFRIASYKIIYEILNDQLIILVLKIEKRGSVYK